MALYTDPVSALDGLREAVTTFEDAGRIARRVLGAAHPLTQSLAHELRNARAVLCVREALPSFA